MNDRAARECVPSGDGGTSASSPIPLLLDISSDQARVSLSSLLRPAPQEGQSIMHVVIRKYATSPEYIEQVRPKLAHLEETMRSLPGFVSYHFVETDDGITTITITEDDRGTAESMGRAKTWMEENTPEDLPGAPEVIQGHTLLSVTR